jgi:ADP-ribose pyrophosphatase
VRFRCFCRRIANPPVSSNPLSPEDHDAPDRLRQQVGEVVVTHRGPVFRVESCEVVDRSGRRARRDIVRHPGAVTVIPVLPDGRVVVIRNERIAVGERLLELCAGKLEPGEEPLVAAGRELEEECGYRAGRLEPLGMFYTSPGFADERMYVFLATELAPVERRLEPGEEIEVEIRSLAELEASIASGELRDGKTLGALTLWRTRSDRSRSQTPEPT